MKTTPASASHRLVPIESEPVPPPPTAASDVAVGATTASPVEAAVVTAASPVVRAPVSPRRAIPLRMFAWAGVTALGTRGAGLAASPVDAGRSCLKGAVESRGTAGRGRADTANRSTRASAEWSGCRPGRCRGASAHSRRVEETVLDEHQEESNRRSSETGCGGRGSGGDHRRAGHGRPRDEGGRARIDAGCACTGRRLGGTYWAPAGDDHRLSGNERRGRGVSSHRNRGDRCAEVAQLAHWLSAETFGFSRSRRRGRSAGAASAGREARGRDGTADESRTENELAARRRLLQLARLACVYGPSNRRRVRSHLGATNFIPECLVARPA